ncbi:hypothetical protein BLOT_015257 [Blomia tropicalis]|nr:hypothetical protein BLOT_015257 [Blomia tropicalis]
MNSKLLTLSCICLIILIHQHECQHDRGLRFRTTTKRTIEDTKENVQLEIESKQFVQRSKSLYQQTFSKQLISLFSFFKPNNEQYSFDGWFHDLDRGSEGSKDSGLMRLFKAQPNSFEMPNVFRLTESLFRSNDDSKQTFSLSGKNLLFVYFGHYILNEILDSRQFRCPPSYKKISFPEHFIDSTGHEKMFDGNNHSFVLLNKLEHCKSVNGDLNNLPRMINLRSVWIDGEIIYGNSKFCSDQMRTFKGGRLIDRHDLALMKSTKMECFNIFGNTLMNENPFIWTIHSIWLRWHNQIADIINRNYGRLTDEQIYHESRKLTIAIIQHIVFDEWLPTFLGQSIPPYQGYDDKLNPQISHVFDAIIPSYLNSLIGPSVISVKAQDCSSNSMEMKLFRTCNSFINQMVNQIDDESDDLLIGLILQSAQRDDQFIVEDIRRFAPGTIDYFRQDWIALIIEQARDFFVPDYLTIRSGFGLDTNTTYSSFSDLTETIWSGALQLDKFLLQKVQTLYNRSIEKIDPLVGALLEQDGYQPGQLITTIIREQFIRLRSSDRLYFENEANGLFTQQQIELIKEIKFSDILTMAIGSVPEGLIPKKSFLLPTNKQNEISRTCRQFLKNLIEEFQCDNYGISSTQSVYCQSLQTRKASKHIEPCTKGFIFDYFNGSELSFSLTIVFIILFIAFGLFLLKLLVFFKYRKCESLRVKASKLRRMTVSENVILAQEWVDHGEPYRSIEVILNGKNKSVKIRLESGDRVMRSIYLKEVTGKVWIECSHNKSQNHVLIRVPKEYDLVLKFDSYYEREKFLAKFEAYLVELNVAQERISQELKTMLKFAYTKMKRQRHLEQFFRVVFSHAFHHKTKENIDVKTAKEIIETELTQFEFAEALSMRPESTFVQQMFSLIDKDNNGYISFREFLDVMVIFAKGSAEQKIRLMFDMYDVNQSGRLSINDFRGMIKSLLEIANQSISSIEMDQTIHSMLNEVGFTSKKELNFEEFSKLFNNYKEELGYSELNFDLSNIANLQTSGNNKRSSALFRANDTIIRAYSYFGDKSGGPDFSSLTKQAPTFLKIQTKEKANEPDWLLSWIRFIDARKKEIFFITLYTLIVLLIFVDKAYYYTYLNEASGFRQVAGLGVTITRGSASVLMFTYSTILLTMCRNLITFLRETFLHQYIPFDGAVTFHKYIAFWAFIMTIIHVVGHFSNFYHISTQRPMDINCLFREIYFIDGQLPKFHTWACQTPTGLTGILLLCLLALMHIFAIQYSRRHVFNAFWRTHNLYPLLYILIVVHGLAKLIQPPIFYFYFIIPFVFTLDRLISASRKKVEISVIKATLHPSNVTHLEFKKPPNFDYKSGQWMRIACVELNSNEYHPFTIASAPHEQTLSMYIRAVGPFTKNLRQIYDCNTLNGRPYPKLYLDGPYGEGHQDWLKFDVSVLVGGGIGITPFASIIKDISFRSSTKAQINCKKVYFIWVTRTQKHFEWMSDVIREAETKDRNNLLVTHIFITQFYEKFDLRTTMLYICERQFQRIANKSLFTGLKAKTHFGRPDFEIFLDSLQLEHPNVERIGVFSCGPNPMTNGVQLACENLNRKEGAIFIHHFENF